MDQNNTTLTLFHTGYLEIPEPDVHYGRINADFGQGFYTTDQEEFALRWAKEKKGADTYVNRYELDTEGLEIRRFERDREWFEYIYQNRSRLGDRYPKADVIIGPIANDTIYDTMGITTSGVLTAEESLPLLMIGPVYRQIVLKTEKAASQLRWISARLLSHAEMEQYKAAVAEEEAQFMEEFAAVISTLV